MYFCDKYWILSKMDKYDKRHQRNLRKLDKELETIYTLWQKEASALVPTINGFDPSREFDINRYPKTKKQLDALTKKYAEAMRVTFESRIKSEWDLAQDKNDEVVKDYFGATARDMKTPSALMSRYLDRNEKALETFLSRKSADTGLSLSERVWKYADGYRTEIEAGLELAIRDGLSANETAKELKKYLRHPDKLFRRVRDKQTGKLKLSKPAKAFHPGTGVYRSSFQNARRLVATEVNIAYRTSDHLRWQSMDFVTGVEVKLSNNHTLNGRPFTDICDDLQGTYPKDFKFTGWHPLCRCYAVPVLEDPDRFFARTFRGEGEAPEGVTDVPDNFKAWVKNNADRISKAEARGKLPYFLKDNTRYSGLKHEKTADEWRKENLAIAKKRHEARTHEQINEIKSRWAERNKSEFNDLVKQMNENKISYLDVKKLENTLSDDDIIKKIGGGDLTKGSCSSVAFAYASNKAGLDVTDFRGGTSQKQFSKRSVIISISDKVGGKKAKNRSDFTNAKELLSEVKKGKEYYFTCGKHAAIVRKAENGIEYLELQSHSENGFQLLTDKKLKKRFGAQKSHTFLGEKYEVTDVLIDIERFSGNDGFRKLMGYINTSAGNQIKGEKGKIK